MRCPIIPRINVNRRFSAATAGAFVAAAAVTCLLLLAGAPTAQADAPTLPAAPLGAPVLALAPAGVTVTVGSTFSVTVQVRTTEPVDGAAAYIDFDRAVLQVAALAAGGTLPSVLQDQVDNDLGRINFAAGVLGTPLPQSDFILATLVFTAAGSSGSTPLTFALADLRKSDITSGGTSVLSGVEGGSVRIVVQPTPTVTPTPPAVPTPAATPTATPPGGAAVIQPAAGGTLQGDLGSVSTLLTLPAGAVDEPVAMYVAVVATPPATGGLKIAGSVFAITAETESGAAVTHFNRPYTLVIHYSDADVGGIDERDLALHYWSDAQATWIEVPGIVNPADNTFTATLDHLTVFALLEGTAQQTSKLYLPTVTH